MLKTNGCEFMVNYKELMSRRESKEFTLATLNQALSYKVGLGKCIEDIKMDGMKFN